MLIKRGDKIVVLLAIVSDIVLKCKIHLFHRSSITLAIS
jgi:hypothetical protein